MSRISIKNETPIAIYNADKKELIAVFKRQIDLEDYLYGYKGKHYCHISNYIRRNVKSHNTILAPTRVAFRFANEKQIQELGEQDFIIKEGYPKWKLKEFNHK